MQFCVMGYTKIGKIVAAHGLKGEVIVVHHLDNKSALKHIKTVFIEDSSKNLIPWFVEKCTPRGEEEMLMKLEEINSKEATKRVYPKELWLTEEDFNKMVSKNAPIALLGFEIVEGKNVLGEIIEVIEQPHQILCSIIYKGNEAYIPLHDQTLLNIDRKAKKVYVELPDGLLDVYAD